ncbi:hypothetical protein A3742_02005 [Oleiphilus sp. HI0071]|uniref:flagellar hook-associated protein FlgK n=1 Tax=unclassified Oleiphilus TaxID=2631174 RepID=UPI0007C3791C|nr:MULTISPECIES: flagellar hook-associated protein FlgK [unclassified Oleiphilus]KZY63141.1 hypothetical protein A3737_14680 [Oleiphilus sp. HI0065]KZY79649.1 hypothetical protein A3742_02005 [Oleiphilus sp. HI0071]KZZ06146.1 hypothetical protein A3744_07680 [Oleiphilus sp. HI0073]KZZ40136.1 hypothetical protein A3758_09685 [Oleiphilus sp. HI0118]KZZ51958.1 hypothetical protein A3760_11400 [Oleiphilus sp. HI0122]KZZ78300.1 hypothetical protein A3767_13140 [Oleiphilus sp. HI0133]
MADLINIGVSGLKTHQVALSVTGNNVANINTPGYSRQEAIIVDKPALQTGGGYVGQGSTVDAIRRITSSYITEQLRTDTSIYQEREAVLEQASVIDNLLASTSTGLTPSMSRFFEALSGAAEDPTSIPQRQLLLTQTEGLVARFQSLSERLESVISGINQQIEADTSSVNALAKGLAEANSAIALASSTGGAGQQPNQLLDERDELLRELSEYVSLQVVENTSNGTVNVYLGKGQPLVLGTEASELRAVRNPEDGRLIDVALVSSGIEQNITDSLTGGSIGGALSFRDGDLSSTINAIGRIAITLADTMNKQHEVGMDLENNLGGLYFSDINDPEVARSRVISNSLNQPPYDQSLSVTITDVAQLTTDNYELRFEGPADSDYIIVNKGTDETVYKSTLSNVFPSRVTIDGFQLTFDGGTYKVGDKFSILPTQSGAIDIKQEVDRVEEIALAAPVRARSSLGNIGSAQISLGEMLDVNSPITNQPLPAFEVDGELTPPLLVRFITDDYYEVLDNSNPADPQPLSPPINNQFFSQGLSNTLFTSDPGATLVTASGADTLTLPAPGAGPYTNGYGAQTLSFQIRDAETGIVTSQSLNIAANASAKDAASDITSIEGVEATAYTMARLSNFTDDGDPTPLGLVINGETITVNPPALYEPVEVAKAINDNAALQGLSIVAVSDGTSVDLRALTGEDIVVEVTGVGDSVDVSRVDPYTPGAPVLATQTVNAGQGIAVGGAIDVRMVDGVSFTSNVSTLFELAPTSQSTYRGFTFDIQGQARKGDEFNIEYNTDGVSDNRNALAMSSLEFENLVQGSVSYGESYSQVVEKIGTVTNRARLESESAQALLIQTNNMRDSISAVNLDEEAGKLVQFQAAYNASAQVVSVARDLFDTLLGAFR